MNLYTIPANTVFKPGLLSAGAWIQRIAQAIAQEVEREHDCKQRQRREDRLMWKADNRS